MKISLRLALGSILALFLETHSAMAIGSLPFAAFPNAAFGSRGFYGQWGSNRGLEVPPQSWSVQASMDGSGPALPIVTPQCQELRTHVARRCTSFEEIDVFFTFDDGLSLHEVNLYRATHPWRENNGGRYHSSVVVPTQRQDPSLIAPVQSMSEINFWLDQWTSQCKLIRRAFIGSHGTPGYLLFKRGERDTGEIKIDEFLAQSQIFCRMAPQGKIQFDACDLVCRSNRNMESSPVGEFLKETQRLIGDSNRLHLVHPAWQGLEILANSRQGLMQEARRAPRFIVPGAASYPTVSQLNVPFDLEDSGNHAVLFQVRNSQIVTDTPISEIPACSDGS